MSGLGIGFGLSSREGCQVRSLRPTLASLLAVAVLMATSGCSDDPSADPSLPASTQPVTSSSPTESETTSTKPQSPIKFVRAWVDAENVAINSGDVTSLLSFEAPSCFNCKQLLKPITRIYQAGGFIHTKGWRMLRPVVSDAGQHQVLVTMLIRGSGETVKRSANSKIEHHHADRYGFSITLTPKAHSWIIAEILIDS
jgi:hypothetical protein